ncbi:glycoside hydrolase family 2 TIM barrel-domain containing protein [Agromyces silvae]|uniref:glycoside hydrolase family 2 TIM barrel-domain containing protein n=1 Tax=Agromyces silvae TaxID=3388266 RepID=UPI00280A867C|nr:glycoside hydrolase family 2 TIM barrel-domain containing protein [Agromyces protaetiae]
MSFPITRLADPTFVSENRLPAHSDHRWFRDEGEALESVSSFEQSLNGRWKFHYANNLSTTVDGFQDPSYDTSGWDDIPVPAHIQLEGYDRPQYVNVQYPWDGIEQIQPGQIPSRHNPIGSYVHAFELNEPLRFGESLSIVFHGAESAVAVWLNGQYVGYATDSFTPSEFDLTNALVDGRNVIAAQVFKWTAGSWLEDQDFYRFSGIFRDVTLYRRPAVHIENLRVETDVATTGEWADLTMRVDVRGSGSVSANLEGVGHLEDRGDGLLVIRIDEPRLWSPEDPWLYQLIIEVTDDAGNRTEVIPQRVGVRRFGIENGVLTLNGSRVVFFGVNRHEFGPRGRVMTRDEISHDLVQLKRIGVNAVRTSHYPNSAPFYELADEYGLMVIDEMNLETHGLWDRIRYFDAPVEEAVPGDRPEWLPALRERATNMFERDKNHASIVIWSLGNESYGGTNLRDLADWFRSTDSRPVHYEGVDWDTRYPDTTDIVSRMYTPAAEVEVYLREHRDKPMILCEFAHAMGNSFGAVGEYMDLAFREPLFQGGFIWDFADQAILLSDQHGRTYFGYGGDCGEAPHDGAFCGNGIFFADHSPTPKAQEVSYLYQQLSIRIGETSFEVRNRFLFTSTDEFECNITLAREGRTIRTASVPTFCAPQHAETYGIPFKTPSRPGEYTIDVSFRLKADTPWAARGHEIAREQRVTTVAQGAPGGGVTPPTPTPTPPRLVLGTHNLGVHGDGFSAVFSRLHGGLQSYRHGSGPESGRQLLTSIPMPSFWHAPTENEVGWGAPFEDGQWLLASRYARVADPVRDITFESDDLAVTVSYTYQLPTEREASCVVSYRVDGRGRVEVTQTVHRSDGMADLPEFGMQLTTQPELDTLRWYGDGPDECYVDRRDGARVGVYQRDVATALTPYLRPQEAGNRTGVRWAEVVDRNGRGLRFECDGGMEFSALPWTPHEIENARHHTELPPVYQTVVRPALMRRGVGGDDSWGARTHPQYRLPATGSLTFRFSFQGV